MLCIRTCPDLAWKELSSLIIVAKNLLNRGTCVGASVILYVWVTVCDSLCFSVFMTACFYFCTEWVHMNIGNCVNTIGLCAYEINMASWHFSSITTISIALSSALLLLIHHYCSFFSFYLFTSIESHPPLLFSLFHSSSLYYSLIFFHSLSLASLPIGTMPGNAAISW